MLLSYLVLNTSVLIWLNPLLYFNPGSSFHLPIMQLCVLHQEHQIYKSRISAMPLLTLDTNLTKYEKERKKEKVCRSHRVRTFNLPIRNRGRCPKTTGYKGFTAKNICNTLGNDFETFSQKSLWYRNLAHCVKYFLNI